MPKLGAWMVNQLTNEIKEELKKIINEISSSGDYQEYLKISEKMKKNKEIITLIEEIKTLQKELVKNEYYKKDLTIIEKEYNEKLKQLNNYPLYQSFLEKQEKINDKLKYVKDEIQNFFDEIILS